MPDLEAIITSSLAGVDSGESGGTNEPTGSDEAIAAEAESVEETGDPSGSEDEAAPKVEASAEIATPVAEKPKKWVRRDQAQKELIAAQAAAKTQVDALNARVKALAWAETQETRDKIRAIEIAEQHPDKFIRALFEDNRYPGLALAALKAHPEYATHFTPAQLQVAAAASAPMDRPKMETFADGSVGYSEEGLEKLLAWERKQAVDEALKQAEEKFGKKYDEVLDPIVQENQAREKYGKSLQRTGEQIANARTSWPRFTEHEGKIKAWLNEQWKTPEGKRKSLQDAYNEVVVKGVLQADRDKMRQELIAEIRGQKQAGVQVKRPAPTAPGTSKSGGKASLESVILKSIEGLE